jgi:hypothetical protein
MLIADHDWLLNLSKIFKGKKYVIRVKPSGSVDGTGDPVMDAITGVRDNLAKLVDRVQGDVGYQVNTVDVNTQFMI